MATDCRALIVERIRERGLMTVAEYMELALYHPELGYYARASVRTGRAGDFTSVDMGPLFGGLLAVQIAEMWRRIRGDEGRGPGPGIRPCCRTSNGRLARDILDWLQTRDAACYEAVRLHLVERSAEAQADQCRTLGPHAGRLETSSGICPIESTASSMPATPRCAADPSRRDDRRRTARGLCRRRRRDRLVERVDHVSSPELATYLEQAGITLEPGWQAEINLGAAAWVRETAAGWRAGSSCSSTMGIARPICIRRHMPLARWPRTRGIRTRDFRQAPAGFRLGSSSREAVTSPRTST
jgi:hypothetical protein